MNDCSGLCIVSFVSDRAGVGHYRNILPLTILKQLGARVLFIDAKPTGTGKTHQFEDEALVGATHILLQRTKDPEIWGRICELIYRARPMPWQDMSHEEIWAHIGRIERDARGQRVPDAPTIIYECDDDVTRLDPQNPAAYRKGGNQISFSPENLRNTERIVRRCDALFVSTPELAAAWGHLNRRVYVLPNSIDFSLRNAWSQRMDRHPDFAGKIIVGWAGGVHHFGDEEPLIPVIRPILERYSNVKLALFSNPMIVARWVKAFGIEHLEGRWAGIDPQPFARYPAVLSQFDIGLGPLAPIPFNISKSELRLLEYGAMGVPYVASKIAPYLRFHRETEGLGGYLASTAEEWREGITRLLEDFEDRAVKSAAIAGIVRERFNTDQVALRWAAALREVRRQRGVSTWMPMAKPGRNQPCPCGSGKKHKACRCYGAWG